MLCTASKLTLASIATTLANSTSVVYAHAGADLEKYSWGGKRVAGDFEGWHLGMSRKPILTIPFDAKITKHRRCPFFGSTVSVPVDVYIQKTKIATAAAAIAPPRVVDNN